MSTVFLLGTIVSTNTVAAGGAPEAGISMLQIIMIIANYALVIFGLVDMWKRPAEAWKLSRKNRILDTVLMVLLGWIGFLIYWFSARPYVIKAEEQLKNGGSAAPSQ